MNKHFLRGSQFLAGLLGLWLVTVFCFSTHSGESVEKGDTVKSTTEEINPKFDFPPRRGPWWREEPDRYPFGPGRGEGRGMRPYERDWMYLPERLENVRKENPELVDLVEENRRVELEIRQKADLYHKSTDKEEQKQLSQKIRSLLENQFNIEMRRQRLEIQMMENRLNQLKAALKLRSENKDRLLTRRLQDIMDNLVMPERPFPGRNEDFRGFPPPDGRRRGGWFAPPPPLGEDNSPKPKE